MFNKIEWAIILTVATVVVGGGGKILQNRNAAIEHQEQEQAAAEEATKDHEEKCAQQQKRLNDFMAMANFLSRWESEMSVATVTARIMLPERIASLMNLEREVLTYSWDPSSNMDNTMMKFKWVMDGHLDYLKQFASDPEYISYKEDAFDRAEEYRKEITQSTNDMIRIIRENSRC